MLEDKNGRSASYVFTPGPIFGAINTLQGTGRQPSPTKPRSVHSYKKSKEHTLENFCVYSAGLCV